MPLDDGPEHRVTFTGQPRVCRQKDVAPQWEPHDRVGQRQHGRQFCCLGRRVHQQPAAETALDPVLQLGQHDVHDGVDLEAGAINGPYSIAKPWRPSRSALEVVEACLWRICLLNLWMLSRPSWATFSYLRFLFWRLFFREILTTKSSTQLPLVAGLWTDGCPPASQLFGQILQLALRIVEGRKSNRRSCRSRHAAGPAVFLDPVCTEWKCGLVAVLVKPLLMGTSARRQARPSHG